VSAYHNSETKVLSVHAVAACPFLQAQPLTPEHEPLGACFSQQAMRILISDDRVTLIWASATTGFAASRTDGCLAV
jgi:hypothetical protein